MAENNGSLIIECLDWAKKLSTEELREVLERLRFTLKMRLKKESHRVALGRPRIRGWRERYAEGGGPRGPISLDEGKILEIADGAERAVPDASFNRAWAENVLRHAMERLKEESARLRTPYDRAVGAFYLEGRPYAEIARDLGCGEEKVRNYVFRGKARLGDFIREFIRDYSSGQEEFDEELRDLREFLGAGPWR